MSRVVSFSTFSEEANEAGDGEESTREEESGGGSPEQVSIIIESDMDYFPLLWNPVQTFYKL